MASYPECEGMRYDSGRLCARRSYRRRVGPQGRNTYHSFIGDGCKVDLNGGCPDPEWALFGLAPQQLSQEAVDLPIDQPSLQPQSRLETMFVPREWQFVKRPCLLSECPHKDSTSALI